MPQRRKYNEAWKMELTQGKSGSNMAELYRDNRSTPRSFIEHAAQVKLGWQHSRSALTIRFRAIRLRRAHDALKRSQVTQSSRTSVPGTDTTRPVARTKCGTAILCT